MEFLFGSIGPLAPFLMAIYYFIIWKYHNLLNC